MRHKHSGRKLGRRADHRKAMLANLTESLIAHGRIETTVTRAKEVRRLVERLVTIARRGDLHSRRLVAARLHTQDAVKKLMDEIAPKYVQRNGGYTRIIKTGSRRGDASPLAILEFVEEELPKKKKAKSAKKSAPKAKTSVDKKVEGSSKDTSVAEEAASKPVAAETDDKADSPETAKAAGATEADPAPQTDPEPDPVVDSAAEPEAETGKPEKPAEEVASEPDQPSDDTGDDSEKSEPDKESEAASDKDKT